MAFYSACKPMFAPCRTNALSDSRNVLADKLVTLGKMIKVEVKPQYAEGELYADNDVAESIKQFTYADVTLNTSTLPLDAMPTMFNTYKTSSSGKFIDRKNDKSNYGAFGYVYGEIVDGIIKYTVTLLHRVKFDLPEEAVETTNDSITFGTPTISGRAYPDSAGQWRTKIQTDSLSNALSTLENHVKRVSSTLVNTDGGVTFVLDDNNSFDFEMNDEPLSTSASLLSSENVPSGTYAEEAAANQDAVSISYQNGVYKITGDLDELEAYTINGVSGKWIGVIVGTGTEDITSVSMNGTRFTAADVSAAQEVGAQDGEFLLWLDAAELVNDSQTIALSTATAGSDMTFIFEDVENDDESE